MNTSSTEIKEKIVMRNFLSERINNLAESETLAMANLSRELKAKGHDVISLSLGEPDFNTPDIIKEAAKKAIDDNYTYYTPVSGYLDLRQAICDKLKRENNLIYEPSQIVVSNGAKQSIANAVMALVNPGEEVIIPAPYWVSYKEIIKLAEAKPVYIAATIENDFKVTPQQIEKAITSKTKLIIFSTPCNPTGSAYNKMELMAIAEMLEKYPQVFVISDEVYEHINFVGAHESIAQFDNIKERVITINGVSKGYAMTGWRIGYMAAHKDIAKACDKLQGQITSAPSSIAQRAALQALKCNKSEIQSMVETFRKRRDLVLDLLKDVPHIKTNIPQGAFYVFFDVSYYYGKSDGLTTVKDGSDLCMYILNKVHVAMVPGSAFGDENCIRFSYATSENLLIEAVRRIKNALAELK
ncbi:MAG: Aspartate aminotransferase [Bacteroidetes bacterium ADurb.Bin408]|nr:MAG: Aspartate aminotransferase [Bacteroidetes bacterium ADurb.Bin408]